MRARLPSFVLTVAVLAVACESPASAPAAAGATQADSAAVAAVRQQEVTALATGDTSLSYMADDIVMLPPGEPAVSGIPASRAWVGAFLKQFRATVNYTSTSLWFGGDLAVEQYAGTLTMTPVAGGQPMTETIKGLHVYRRDAGGTWKMLRDAWNGDTPPPGAPAH